MVSKNRQKIGQANGILNLPTGPTQVALRGNVGSLDAPSSSQLFTFGPREQCIAERESSMVSKNPQKIREANGMPSLPTGPTQVTKTGNVGSVGVFRLDHLSTFGPSGQDNVLRGS